MLALSTTAQGVIFDLDGTLYEDTEHFSFYARALSKLLPQEKQNSYLEGVQRSFLGLHPLRLGRVYDRERDLILETTPQGLVEKAYSWEGEAQDVSSLYPHPIAFNMTHRIPIGDGWWIPSAHAYHYGVESTQEAYAETKDYLFSNEGSLQPIPGLKEFLLAKKSAQRILILATNSTEEDARRILCRLGLENVFCAILGSCDKPRKSRELFLQIITKWGGEPSSWVSIGDNFINDVAPALDLSMQGILIDPHHIYEQKIPCKRVTSIRELFR